jgi:hypothetical protein
MNVGLDVLAGAGFKPARGSPANLVRESSSPTIPLVVQKALKPKRRQIAAYISDPSLRPGLKFRVAGVGAFRFTLFFISHFFLLYT